MRFYTILISNTVTGQTITYSSLASLSESSYGGKTLLGALNVEFDIPIAAMVTPISEGAIVKIWGIGLDVISQTFDLNPVNGAPIATMQVYAGMAPGLPLANPQQAGLILEGSISQAFGNAVGVDRSIEFVVIPAFGTVNNPANLTTTWKKGINLGQMLTKMINTAYPGLTVDCNVNSNLVLNQDEPGFFGNLWQLSQYVHEISKHIMTGNKDYPGVNMVVHGNKITISDGTVQPTPTQIAFDDLIGQPTWLGVSQMQFRTPMRADINVLDNVTMPAGLVTNTAQTGIFVKNKPIFQGTFTVIRIRHAGNFRQPDGNSWLSIFDCLSTPAT
jgi:hypothetical protein